MKKFNIFLIWVMGCMSVLTPVSAQRKLQFGSDEGKSIPGRPGWLQLTKNVFMLYEGTVVKCNYAEVNQSTEEFEARDNLRIRTGEGATITGLTLHRDPKSNAMIINQNVVFTDKDSTKLYTDRMIYNQNTNVSTYTTGGRIISDSTVLTSKIGHYYGKTKAFHCKTDVVIVDPSYTIHTDTLQMVNDRIYFFSPTHVWSDSNYLYCENGWYKIKEKTASLTDNAFIQTKEQKMYGDSIFYKMEDDFGVAFGNVTVIDSLRDIIIHSNFALSDKKHGDAWFTQNAVGIVISETDSLFLRGDTLRMAYDSNNDVRHMLAYYNVRYFRHDMQGACDSLSYVMKDSTLTMFGSPIVWTTKDQLTGDTIQVLLSQNKPKHMHLVNHAFIASKGYYEGHFNQVKGREVNGFFNDSSQLERIKVDENVETVYFVTDDTDRSLIGILKVNSEQMEIALERQVIVSINYFKPQDGAMYPEIELPQKDRTLKGFLWQEERRPKSKSDIWTPF